MPIIAKSSGSASTPAPFGTHIARCIQVIDIGSHTSTFDGDERTQRKVSIAWELPEETHVFDPNRGEEPFVISKEYTLSTSEKSNLRRDLESWRGKPFTKEEVMGFDVAKLIGVPAMVSVVHQEKKNGSGVYAKVTAVTRLPKSATCPPGVLETIEYSVDQGRNAVFKALPEWMRTKISQCEEWKEYPTNADPTPAEADNPPPADDDSLPF